jgi:uncharacterized protein
MVLQGQFLERPTLIPTGEGLVLEGLSHRGTLTPPLLVLPPPPAEGSGMDHVVGAELAFAVSHAGFPTLRFNYRGVGGSQGRRATRPEDLLEDALAALALVGENAGGAVPAVVAIGASDAIALRLAAQVPLRALALINPSLVTPNELAGLPGGLEVSVIFGELDERCDRAAWGAALEALAGHLEIVPGAGRTYQRNLPMVGKAVVALLAKVVPKR